MFLCLTSVGAPPVPAILLAALRRRVVSAVRQQHHNTTAAAAQDGKAGKTHVLLVTDSQEQDRRSESFEERA